MRELVRKAQQQDADAFIQLMEMHKESMYKIARSYLRCDADIADVMQETILDSFEKIHTLQNPKYFKTWMIRILINNCNDIIRKGANICSLDHFDHVEFEAHGENLVEFQELLDSIDEKYRSIFILYYVEGYKIKEIAQLLDMNESTVNSRLRRSRMVLKKELQNALM